MGLRDLWTRRAVAAPAPRGLITVKATGSYEFEVVGEASYQLAIAQAIGGWPHNHAIDRIRQEFTARVAAEPTNAYDPNAVRVSSIDGATLAYFARPQAARYAPLFAAINETCDFEVPAIVAARWIGTRWNGGVWLDLPSPEEIVAAIKEHA